MPKEKNQTNGLTQLCNSTRILIKSMQMI